MIVKTGANYQAEGGYIEASKTGVEVSITANDMKAVVPNLYGIVDSFVTAKIRKEESVKDDVTIFSVNSSGTRVDAYYVVTTDRTFRLGYKIGSVITSGGNAIQLLTGSEDCRIETDSESGKQLLVASGPNPIAILGVA